MHISARLIYTMSPTTQLVTITESILKPYFESFEHCIQTMYFPSLRASNLFLINVRITTYKFLHPENNLGQHTPGTLHYITLHHAAVLLSVGLQYSNSVLLEVMKSPYPVIKANA